MRTVREGPVRVEGTNGVPIREPRPSGRRDLLEGSRESSDSSHGENRSGKKKELYGGGVPTTKDTRPHPQVPSVLSREQTETEGSS